MAIWQDVWQLGQKVLALTKTTETNTSEIKKLQHAVAHHKIGFKIRFVRDSSNSS